MITAGVGNPQAIRLAPLLITGATGNVGREVARLLGERGYPVRLAMHHDASASAGPESLVPSVHLDFRDPTTFGAALAGVRSIFLMRPPDLTDIAHALPPFIDAAEHAGVEHIVFLSLIGAAKNRFVPHHKIEALLQGSRLSWTFLRPSFFMQNLVTTHHAEIRDRGEIIIPAGTGRTSFIDVRDIAAVAVKVLTEPGHRGQAYDLTGAEALDYAAVAEVLSRELGKPIRYTNPSPLAFARYQRAHHTSWAFLWVMLGIYTTTRLGMAARLTQGVADFLGRPPITLRQFAHDYRASWLA